MLYVFYITTTPYLPCNNNNINRKELYDFYYTAITLTQRDINNYSSTSWVQYIPAIILTSSLTHNVQCLLSQRTG